MIPPSSAQFGGSHACSIQQSAAHISALDDQDAKPWISEEHLARGQNQSLPGKYIDCRSAAS